jgi:hypothetical protein
MTSVLAFLVSEENLGADKDTILLGDVKKYLNKCFNGNGEILTEMGFGAEIEAFESLKEAELSIEDIQNEFKNKKNMFVYTEYLSQINERNDFNSQDLSLIALGDSVDPAEYKFTDLLNKVNIEGISHNDHWDINSDSPLECSYSEEIDTQNGNYHPKKCWPTNKAWVRANTNIKDKTTIILDKIKALVTLANGDSANSIKNILEDNTSGLKVLYETFLNLEISTLSTFLTRIQILTKIVSNYSGKNEKMFNFANCGFIKTNIQILIKNLKDAFGNDLYTIGVFFLLAAFSMAIAISSTILLIVIINTSTGNNQKPTTEDKVKEEEEPNSKEKFYKKNEEK